MEFDKDTLEARKKGAPAALIGKNRGGVDIYESKTELEETLRGEPGREPVVSENTTVTKPLLHSSPRFPLIGSSNNEVADKAGRLLEIGYIGDQIYSAGGHSKSRPGEAVATDIEKLNRLMPKLKAIDIVFVIDATGSMSKYFEAAREAVLKIASTVGAPPGGADAAVQADQPHIRYSVNFYRDYPDAEKSYLTKRLPLTEDVSKVTGFLSEEKSEGGGDEHEAVFCGIDSAIAGCASEMDEYSFKIMVLIGDAGNHKSDEREYDEEKTAESLKKAKFSFSYIVVVDPKDITKDSPAADFRDQAERIKGRLEEQTNGGIATQNPELVAQSIVETAEMHVKYMKKTVASVRAVSTGTGLNQIGSEYGVIVQRKLTDAMVAAKIDPNTFLEQSAQVFGTGFTSEKDREGRQQCRVMLLVERGVLDQLNGLIAGFIAKPASRNSVGDLWKTALQGTIGDFDASKPVRELIVNHVGVPVKLGILQKNLEEISKMSDEDLRAAWVELDKAKQNMAALLSEKRIRIELIEKPAAGGRSFRVQDLGNRKIWWNNDGSPTEYGWLPASELP